MMILVRWHLIIPGNGPASANAIRHNSLIRVIDHNWRHILGQRATASDATQNIIERHVGIRKRITFVGRMDVFRACCSRLRACLFETLAEMNARMHGMLHTFICVIRQVFAAATIRKVKFDDFLVRALLNGPLIVLFVAFDATYGRDGGTFAGLLVLWRRIARIGRGGNGRRASSTLLLLLSRELKQGGIEFGTFEFGDICQEMHYHSTGFRFSGTNFARRDNILVLIEVRRPFVHEIAEAIAEKAQNSEKWPRKRQKKLLTCAEAGETGL